MYDFFKDIALESEEKLSEKRVDSIKAAVLSRIKKENSMKKISAFKTFSIAAIVAATAAMSAMLASAEKPASLPTKQPAAANEQSTPATAETPENTDEKTSDKQNAAGDIQTEPNDGKWVYLELPNGKKAEYYVPDGKVPMTFDNVQAAIDYAIDYTKNHSTPLTPEQEWVTTFDACDNFAVWLVDA